MSAQGPARTQHHPMISRPVVQAYTPTEERKREQHTGPSPPPTRTEDTSKNLSPLLVAHCSASCSRTVVRATRSFLFPTNTPVMGRSLSLRCVRNSCRVGANARVGEQAPSR